MQVWRPIEGRYKQPQERLATEGGSDRRVQRTTTEDEAEVRQSEGRANRSRSSNIESIMPQVVSDMSTPFTVSRVNSTTWAICENDSYGEHPIIYCLIHPTLPLIIISDTGCDSPNKSKKNGKCFTIPYLDQLLTPLLTAKYVHLLDFLRHYPIPENSHQPLDAHPGERSYIIICTHCHFDHINGIEQFATLPSTELIAPAAGRSFIESDLPTHSLCRFLGIPTPSYKITHWATHKERLLYSPSTKSLVKRQATACQAPANQAPADAQDIGITILSTPGHTPDELAWYDHSQHHLYVGDSFYLLGHPDSGNTYTGPIIFPKEGNWTTYMRSLYALYDFVDLENWRLRQEGSEQRVLVGCGHTNTAEEAEGLILEVIGFFKRIIAGQVSIVERGWDRGERIATWGPEKGGKLAVRAPVRLWEEARKAMGMGMVDWSDEVRKGSVDSRKGDVGDIGTDERLRIRIVYR